MISETRLRKIEKEVKVVEKKNYKYIFISSEEFKEAKRLGIVDPEPNAHIIILNA